MTTPPFPGIHEAFSSAGFLASAEGADQAPPAEAEAAAPAPVETGGRCRRARQQGQACQGRILSQLARSKSEDFARKIGRPRASRMTR